MLVGDGVTGMAGELAGARVSREEPHPERPSVTAPGRLKQDVTTTQPEIITTTLVAPTTSLVAATTTLLATTTTAGPTSSTIAVSAGQVQLQPGSSLQGAVDAHPAGTAFVLASGTYRGQSVTPKDGNAFLGQTGAVLAGNGQATAFSGSASKVRIQGLVIEGYNTASQHGAIHASGWGWVVKDNEIRNNAAGGVVVASGSVVAGNFIHHNGQFGVKAGGDGVLIEGNELSYNNHQKAFDPDWEAGGMKSLQTLNLVVRGNFAHHNYGPGLWTDYQNFGTVYEDNVIADNYGIGIFHEVSGNAIIRRNQLLRNGGLRPDGQYNSGGIIITNSENVEVYANELRDNTGGIGGVEGGRTDGYPVRNLWVHDNVIQYGRWWSGIFYTGGNSDPYSAGANNRFDANTYILGGAANGPFRWGGYLDFGGWQAVGQDPNGRLG